MNKTFEHKLHLRNLRADDYPTVKSIMQRVYKNVDAPWQKDQVESMISRFPEGQICIVDKGKTVAVVLTLIIDYAEYGEKHTYLQVVGDGKLENHDPDGDYLYGIEVFVDPDYQGMRKDTSVQGELV